MGRIRTIKPEFWKHEDLSALPEATHILAAALLNYADDEGYFNANPGLVRSECTPLREPSVSVHDSLIALSRIGFVELFDGTDGKRYGRVVKFDDHQRVNRPTPSKIKALRVAGESSVMAHTQLSESSSPERNREQGREQGTGNREDSSLRSDSSSGDADDIPPRLALDGVPADRSGSSGRGDVREHPTVEKVVEVVLEAYHRLLPRCQTIHVLTPDRRKRVLAADKLARQLCSRQGWKYSPAVFWSAYFTACAKDDWLRGDRPNPNNPRWKQNLAVLIGQERFATVMDEAIEAMRADADESEGEAA